MTSLIHLNSLWFFQQIPDQPINSSRGNNNTNNNSIPRRPPNIIMDQLSDPNIDRITRHRVTPSSSSSSSSYATSPSPQRRLPTPREIFDGLNEYVIGQRNVKIALSVGVHNHYKRIAVMEAQQSALQTMQVETINQQQQQQQQRREGHLGVDASDSPLGYQQDAAPFREPTIADLRLNQFGRSSTIVTPPPSPSASEDSSRDDANLSKPFCETPDVRSIANPNHNIGPEVEDCELDKSNIIIIG